MLGLKLIHRDKKLPLIIGNWLWLVVHALTSMAVKINRRWRYGMDE